MLTEAQLIHLRYIHVRFVDEPKAMRLLTKQNLPINRFGSVYYLSPRQRRMCERHNLKLK
jgi:hypothetical protein